MLYQKNVEAPYLESTNGLEQCEVFIFDNLTRWECFVVSAMVQLHLHAILTLSSIVKCLCYVRQDYIGML